MAAGFRNQGLSGAAAAAHLQHLLHDEVQPVDLLVVVEVEEQRGEQTDSGCSGARDVRKLARQPQRQQAQHVPRQARHTLNMPLLHRTPLVTSQHAQCTARIAWSATNMLVRENLLARAHGPGMRGSGGR